MPGGGVLEVRIRGKAFPSAEGAVREILREIDFTAASGEVLALVGPSGIGKSTVLRIVLGLDRDFDGRVRLPPGRIGVVFQEPRLLPWMPVGDNVRLVRSGRADASEIAALLDEVMLPRAEYLLPSALSLGMARRVALARALAVDPETLVLDEPFASLDRSLGAALGARVAYRARKRGTVVLLSTHDLDQALAMASRILVLWNDPATLAADLAVPRREDGAATARLRQDLLTRFTFLESHDSEMLAVR